MMGNELMGQRMRILSQSPLNDASSGSVSGCRHVFPPSQKLWALAMQLVRDLW